MNKKEIINSDENKSKNKFHLALIIGMYLLLDIIILFFLCILEINDVNHRIVLTISFVAEFLLTLYVSLRGNIKSGIIYYILLLVSPVFLGLLAMSMNYLTNEMFFTPTVLVLFRNGYMLNGVVLNSFMRFMIIFRIPALFAITLCIVIYFITKSKLGE